MMESKKSEEDAENQRYSLLLVTCGNDIRIHNTLLLVYYCSINEQLNKKYTKKHKNAKIKLIKVNSLKIF